METNIKSCIQEEISTLTEVSQSALEDIEKKCRTRFEKKPEKKNTPNPPKKQSSGFFGYVLVIGIIITIILFMRGGATPTSPEAQVKAPEVPAETIYTPPAVVEEVNKLKTDIDCSDACISGGSGFCAAGITDKKTCITRPQLNGVRAIYWHAPDCCCYCEG